MPVASTPVPSGPAPIQQKASEDLTKRGIAGKGIGKGILATPTGTFLRIADRPVFLNIQHAMDLYKAEHGAPPGAPPTAPPRPAKVGAAAGAGIEQFSALLHFGAGDPDRER